VPERVQERIKSRLPVRCPGRWNLRILRPGFGVECRGMDGGRERHLAVCPGRRNHIRLHPPHHAGGKAGIHRYGHGQGQAVVPAQLLRPPTMVRDRSPHEPNLQGCRHRGPVGLRHFSHQRGAGAGIGGLPAGRHRQEPGYHPGSQSRFPHGLERGRIFPLRGGRGLRQRR
jgi:hypothetical protein